MRIWLSAALALSLCAPSFAQTKPEAPERPKVDDLVAILRTLAPLPPDAVRAGLAAANSESPAVRYLAFVVSHYAEEGPGVDAFIADSDPDSSLRREIRSIATAPAQTAGTVATRKGLETAAKTIDGIKAQDFDGGGEEPEKDGFEHRTGVFGGVANVGPATMPAAGLSHNTEWKKGPWGGEFEFEGVASPGPATPSTYSLGISGTRQLGNSRVRGLIEAETDSDSYLGAQGLAVRAGVSVPAVETKKQELNISFGIGPNREAKFNGEVEQFISPAVAVEYVLKLGPDFRFMQAVEGEFNAVHHSDIEFKSVTSAIYDVSKTVAIKAANTFKLRTEQVDGYAAQRTFGTLGVVINY